MDPRELRKGFGLFTTGVIVVTAINPGPEPVGVTANSVTSVSLDPPLILWCLANKSGSLKAFALGAPFAIHILAVHQADIALHFARSEASKFEVDTEWRSHPMPPDIEGALARIECHVSYLYPGGDHTIIVGIIDKFSARNAQPLAFHASHLGRFINDQSPSEVSPWPDPRGTWL